MATQTKSGPTSLVAAWVPSDVAAALKVEARASERTVSAELRRALKLYLATRDAS